MKTLFVTLVVIAVGACHAEEARSTAAPKVRFTEPAWARANPLSKFNSVSESDGQLRLHAMWVRSTPARDILTEDGEFVLSSVEGFTYEFFVLLENTGKDAIVVPSSTRSPSPKSNGLPAADSTIVTYIIRFDQPPALDYRPLVTAPEVFRPVKLYPGESVRLPIYYRIVESDRSLQTHWFYYYVDEDIARRYGWWSGALKCKAEEYRPNKSPEPTRTVAPPTNTMR